MTALPANLPGIAHAKLPATYEAAKSALAECSRIDECMEWANKAEAMASYAKQANDDSLRKMADRIQARAIRRCGELLKQVEPGKGGRPSKNPGDRRPSLEGWVPGTGTNEPSLEGWVPGSRSEFASSVGMTEHRKKSALRVAEIPEEQFEHQVESANPPSVNQLAQQGIRPAPKPLIDLQGRDPADFRQSTRGQGFLREFAEFCRATDAEIVARGALPREVAAIRSHVSIIDGWLDRLVTRLEE